MADIPRSLMASWKFTRASFGPLLTIPRHLDLIFDIQETAVTVIASTTFVHTGAGALSLLRY